ncbi:beta-ketothiolase BktB [Arenicella xantha]|uniref:Acetyl-CoA C-acetyltransferase n=1 Tax=Arenicella xantha TaxID=644221 RepID=A0A395JNQ9_9GAMM|nr:beta-ketothiolase BktB [Arenicella xantha]RBP53281.1 acetyl-CoA C-acetyltransferase [Arenicella xantha]
MLNDVFIISATRTAIGSFGGALKGVSPADLGVHVSREAIRRSGIDPQSIGSNVVGHVIRSDIKDAYMARRVALNSDMPVHTQSLTLNRLCGSGLEAITFASQQLQLGEVSVAVAGGTESMSSAAHLLTTNRWGQPMGDGKIQDELTGSLTDPFGVGHMGITAENLAEKYAISREEQDAFALLSQQRAVAAIEAGYFAEQIVPYEIKSRKGSTVFDTDEHPRASSTLEQLARLRAVFKDGGSVTAGNASGINDGAGMVVLATEDQVKQQSLKPMARVVSYGRCGVPNEIMGIGPVGASTMALSRAGLKVSDLDVIESNEAFAAQALTVAKELEFPDDKTNPNGGAIALGHPVGASGAIILTKLIYELHRVGGRYGLATLCIGGGQGIAMIVEAV